MTETCTEVKQHSVMLTLFWDKWAIILKDYMLQWCTATSATYSDFHKNYFWPLIKSKWCGLLSTHAVLQDDSTCFHTAHATVLYFKWLPRLTYLPYPAPCGYHIFGPLRELMGWKTFRSEEDMKHRQWLHSRPIGFFYTWFHVLCRHWRTCIEYIGDYVEKYDAVLWHFCFSKLWGEKY